jgi:hypothetical protein
VPADRTTPEAERIAPGADGDGPGLIAPGAEGEAAGLAGGIGAAAGGG